MNGLIIELDTLDPGLLLPGQKQHQRSIAATQI